MSRLNILHRISLLLALGAAALSGAAQVTDPDPNSPTPVLVGAPDPARALAARETDKTAADRLPSAAGEWFDPFERVVLYVTNVNLLPGEGANAFRVYAVDRNGREFRFPVVKMRPVKGAAGVFALTVELRSELDDAQPAKGDLLLSVAWRGLASNRRRLGFGAAGGAFPGDAGALSPTGAKSASEPAPTTNAVGYRFAGDRTRFLEQATFGPTPALEQRVHRLGLRTWLTEQLELIAYPTYGNPYPAYPLRPTTPPVDCNGLVDNGSPDSDPFCFVNHYTMYPLQNWFYREAFYGNGQLRHRVAWALAQLWVVSGAEIQQSSHLTAYHKTLTRNAFGNWRTLMQEMTLNPAMGGYLNMRTSTRYTPNENYAREILQLFNVGLFMLNPDGTLRLDAQNNPIPTYDQTVVNNFTLTFTGWSLCEVAGCPNRVPGSPNYIDPMIVANPDNHDLSAKTLLSYPGSTTTNIPACPGCTGAAVTAYANASLNQALDNIYNHPNVAPFVSRFLIQQLVTGDPTPAYVGRVAAVFNANRTNPTQLKEVIRAILLDPEARGDAKTEPHYGKLREPVLLATNLARQFDVRSADRGAESDGVLTTETGAMGQIAFMAPSVFNFYPPDYVSPGTTFKGPEFALYTTGTAVTRLNFVNNLVFGRVEPNAERHVTAGTSLGFDEYAALAAADPTGDQLLDLLNVRLLHGTMSPAMRATILGVVRTVPAANPDLRARRAVYLVATSSQYQVQR
ncbi:MAG: DUF1800 family protein [Acidobacteria bacterium]|nr:DUF1800 family protein [Acidobacteriota bacterium]